MWFASALVLALSIAGTGGAQSIEPRVQPAPPGVYEFVIGTEFLAAYDPTWDPAISETGRGDTVVLRGFGVFDMATGTISGDGTFVHLDGSGGVVATGSWTATEFLSFRSYGSASAQGWPENFYGGTAKVAVVLTPAGGGAATGATLQIDSSFGHPPPGRDTGIRLQVGGGLNFNQKVSGGTLFILM